MRTAPVICHSALLLVALTASPQQPASQPPKEHTTRTRVVLLGTGTPVPDPDRSGSATAIVVDDSAYHAWISWWPSIAPSGNQPVVLSTGELHSSPDVLQKEIGSRYSGTFVIGRDLDVY